MNIKKRGWIFVIILLGIFLIFNWENIVSAFSGSGGGTSGSPYIITNCTQLQEMNDDLTATYILGNNINCSNTTNWNSGAGFEPIGDGVTGGEENAFTGTFNGNGYDIIGLYINRPNEYYVGLFGYSNGDILNVNLINVNVTGLDAVGGLVGWSDSYYYISFIGNCSVGGIVKGRNNVGGLAGDYTGLINYSSSSSEVIANTSVGGLIGYTYSGSTISNSYSTGKVSGKK
jgi:hypothetical protein